MKYILVFFFIFNALLSTAQGELNARIKMVDFIFTDYPSATFGLEYTPSLYDGTSIIFDFGWLIETELMEGDMDQGNRYTIQLRQYFGRDLSERFFLGFKYDRRNFALNSRYTLGYRCGNGLTNCLYYQDFNGVVETYRNVFALQAGIKTFASKNQRLKLEAGISYGSEKSYLDRNSINGGVIANEDLFLKESDFGNALPYFDIFFNFSFTLLNGLKKETQ